MPALPTTQENQESCDSQYQAEQPRRRSITFHQAVRVVPIPHINDFEQEDIDLLWWSEDEHQQTMASCRRTIAKMNAGLVLESGICTRGLEKLAKSKSAVRKLRRKAAMKAILMEQRYQEQEGLCDPELLRTLYRDLTASSRTEANLLALRDQKEAMAALHESFCPHRSVKPGRFQSSLPETLFSSPYVNITAC